MRRLSERQAQRCEDATTPRCRCRCNGANHGTKRGVVTRLPKDDPHSANPTTGPSCIAYLPNGHLCGAKAIALDPQRGGMVCGEHAQQKIDL